MPQQTSAASAAGDTTPQTLAAIHAATRRAAGRAAKPAHAPAAIRRDPRAATEWHLERATTTARASFNPASGNRKTGAVATMRTDRTTCPHTCPLRATPKDGGADHAARMADGERVPLTLHGCYADGHPLARRWNELTRGDAGGSWADMVRAIADTPRVADEARAFEAGDMPTDPATGRPDWHAMAALAYAYQVAGYVTAWGYTHHLPTPATVAILDALEGLGLVLMMSANNPAHADTLRAAYPHRPVAVVVPMDTPRGATTPAGHKLTACLSQVNAGATCSTCGGGRPLCARASGAAPLMVAFRVHGLAHKRAGVIAAGGAA